MFKDKRVMVVMPAYNAGKTLEATHSEVLAQDYVDQVIVVDDASHDDTVNIAKDLPRTKLVLHPANKGYGANQKTCYRHALEAGADIVIMVHPDYQYTPKLIPAFVSMIGSGLYHCVLGSRILGGNAIRGGMPVWKYMANRILTLFENVMMGANCQNTTPATEGFHESCSKRCLSKRIRTISCSTIKCSRRFFGEAILSQRSVARPNISPKPRR
jgi:glycosyltransferase involved in cell wall biosynthesis